MLREAAAEKEEKAKKGVDWEHEGNLHFQEILPRIVFLFMKTFQ